MRLINVLLFCVFSFAASAQVTLRGEVTDASTKEPIVGATIAVKGTSLGTVTDLDGKFELSVPTLPQTLVISNLSYSGVELVVSSYDQPIRVGMKT